jgi:hypothetical protein
MSNIKTYSDTYLYQKYPIYTKKLTDAIMRDPVIEKNTDQFSDVEYVIKKARISDSLVNILKSRNVILLDCEDPLPRAFKVFAARDMKSKDRNIKIFIDCTGVITKSKTSMDYSVNESKLLSYLLTAGVTMAYHKDASMITRRASLVKESAEAFAKSFTFIIDYLTKVSIQESSKVKVMYLSSMYFLEGMLGLDEARAQQVAKKIAGISEREANMLDLLLEKYAVPKGGSSKNDSPYENIKIFIGALREVMHFNKKTISVDIVVERWMHSYGVGTVFALEYFPAFSSMMTDAYIGGYLNSQKTIEKVCGTSMVNYSKDAIDFVSTLA